MHIILLLLDIHTIYLYKGIMCAYKRKIVFLQINLCRWCDWLSIILLWKEWHEQEEKGLNEGEKEKKGERREKSWKIHRDSSWDAQERERRVFLRVKGAEVHPNRRSLFWVGRFWVSGTEGRVLVRSLFAPKQQHQHYHQHRVVEIVACLQVCRVLYCVLPVHGSSQ